MEILGSGLIARSLQRYATRVPDALVFARGVADSTTTDPSAYARELAALDLATTSARATDRRLVYFSGGGALHGDLQGVRDETTPLAPTTAYGRHNAAAEARIRASGARFVIIRLANLVGAPQHPRQLIPSLVEQAIRGRATLQVAATRDVLDADDAARLVVRVLEAGVDREVLVVARGRSEPVPRLFERIVAILGVQPVIELREAGQDQRFSVDRLAATLGCRPDELGVNDIATTLQRHVPELAQRVRASTAGR